MIDFDPELPKWRQVADVLRERIETGVYRPKQMIPSIVRITQEFEVSRNTARKVLDHLADEGLVRKRPAMGTFVVPPGEREPGGRD